MLKQTVAHESGLPVVLADSITKIDAGDAGAVVVSGSHGGRSSGEFALIAPFAAVFFSDAGIGKDEAGIAGLAMLDERGTPSCAVGHESGRIGDAADLWEHGLVTRVNRAARERGAAPGMTVKEAAAVLARRAAATA